MKKSQTVNTKASNYSEADEAFFEERIAAMLKKADASTKAFLYYFLKRRIYK